MNYEYENIVLVCLDGDFCRLVCEELSDKLDMFFADLKAYIEYDLLDSKAVLDTCGIDYFKERETSATKNFAKFSNSILTVDFDLFKQNRKAFTKKSLIVYIKIPKKLINKDDTINIINYQNYDEYLQKECSVVVELKSKAKTKAVQCIMKKMGDVL